MASRRSPRSHLRDPAPCGAGSFFCAAAIALAVGAPAPAAAGAARFSVEPGAGLTRFGYVERAPGGAVLDREAGLVPGLAVRAEAAGAAWFARGALRASRGEVEYEGRVSSPSAALDGLEVRTTTAAAFLSGEAQLGAWLGAGRRIALYAGAGARRWRREIRPTTVVSRSGVAVAVGGLDETYAWGELQAGVRVAALRARAAEVELDVRAVHPIWPTLAVDWFGRTVELDLGARPGLRAALALRWLVHPRVHLVAEPSLELSSLGRSRPDPATGVFEPDSETRTFGLEARVGTRF